VEMAAVALSADAVAREEAEGGQVEEHEDRDVDETEILQNLRSDFARFRVRRKIDLCEDDRRAEGTDPVDGLLGETACREKYPLGPSPGREFTFFDHVGHHG
jgi:hypothetical protein